LASEEYEDGVCIKITDVFTYLTVFMNCIHVRVMNDTAGFDLYCAHHLVSDCMVLLSDRVYLEVV